MLQPRRVFVFKASKERYQVSFCINLQSEYIIAFGVVLKLGINLKNIYIVIVDLFGVCFVILPLKKIDVNICIFVCTWLI